MATDFTLNGKPARFDGDPETPLLYVLRDHLGLTGTKYGCGIAQCGACTVHLDGKNRRSCVTPVSMVSGKQVTTIEGVAGKEAEAVQKRLGGDRRAAMRLLPVRAGDVGDRLAQDQEEAERQRYRRGDGGQYLPLRHLCPHPPGDPRRRQSDGGLSDERHHANPPRLPPVDRARARHGIADRQCGEGRAGPDHGPALRAQCLRPRRHGQSRHRDHQACRVRAGARDRARHLGGRGDGRRLGPGPCRDGSGQ